MRTLWDQDAAGRGWNLVSLFSASVEAVPDRTALVADGRELSYRELDGWANALAELLSARGVGPGDRVGLRMLPGPEAIASLVGILKTGAAYVPLDIRHPAARNQFILRDCAASAFVGDLEETTFTAGPVITSPQVTELSGRAAPAPATPVPAPQDMAYVMYTSGTTGTPKGVPIRHGGVVTLLSGSLPLFALSERDRWLLFHSMGFDASVWEIWGAFSTGATLVVLPYWTARTPEDFRRMLREQSISVLTQTPTAFTALTDPIARSGQSLPDLRYVVFVGEKLTPGSLRAWVERFGLDRPRLVTMYGPTEATVYATYQQVTTDQLARDVSNIGQPLPGMRVRVVSENGGDVAAGAIGELWLAGPQITEGYLNLPEADAGSFRTVTDPETGESVRYYRTGDLVYREPNGDVVFLGRADLQIKLRGHRIELTEVEATVRGHPAVADAVVSVRKFKEGDIRLVCLYTAQGAEAPGAPELRRHVSSLLPPYMRPARYRCLPELPRTVNGKLDRAAVAELWEDGASSA